MGIGAIGGAIVGAVDSSLRGYYQGQDQQRAVELQNQGNIQLWKMQTEYNTPANQVARLRAAGLNPNLIYGNGSASTGNATPAPRIEAAPKARYSFDVMRALDVYNVILQQKNLHQQNQNLKAQTDDIKAQTRQRNAQADYDNVVLQFYRKHGYFPGQTSAPTNVVREISNQMKGSPVMEHSSEALGNFVGKIVSSYDSDPDRGTKMAVQTADKKGLKGQERVNFIRKFKEIYDKTH